jgi:hypothetical protein
VSANRPAACEQEPQDEALYRGLLESDAPLYHCGETRPHGPHDHVVAGTLVRCEGLGRAAFGHDEELSRWARLCWWLATALAPRDGSRYGPSVFGRSVKLNAR